MGREIFQTGDEEFSFSNNQKCHHLDHDKIKSISKILHELKSFAPNELRMLFETMFSRMSLGAKEAMTELMWSGLGPSEQQSFELPYFGSRWNDDSISLAFINAFHDPSHGVLDENRNGRNHSNHNTAGRSRILTDHTVSHTFSGGISASTSTNATTRGTTTRLSAAAPPRSIIANLSNEIEQDLTSHVRMEEEFYNILRNAIQRAEQSTSNMSPLNRTDRPRQRVYTHESDPNGNDTDDIDIQMDNELM